MARARLDTCTVLDKHSVHKVRWMDVGVVGDVDVQKTFDFGLAETVGA